MRSLAQSLRLSSLQRNHRNRCCTVVCNPERGEAGRGGDERSGGDRRGGAEEIGRETRERGGAGRRGKKRGGEERKETGRAGEEFPGLRETKFSSIQFFSSSSNSVNNTCTVQIFLTTFCNFSINRKLKVYQVSVIVQNLASKNWAHVFFLKKYFQRN